MTPYQLKDAEKNPVNAVRGLCEKLLKGTADYVFAQGCSPYSVLPMPMLVGSPDRIKMLTPLAPVAPFNAAKQASSVLKSNTGKTIALLLKPCEKRALVELAKLVQCDLENAIIITSDCKGRMENRNFLALSPEKDTNNGKLAIEVMQTDAHDDQLTSSCRMCTQFTDDGSDIHIHLFASGNGPVFAAQTEKGNDVLKAIDCQAAKIPEGRDEEIARIMELREKQFQASSETILAKTSDIEKFQQVIANCLNCYNCRTACPVCYCKECVFVTDIFDHMPETLQNRVDKKGVVKLPTDTTMFHLTRLAHISHACVGCGHCSSVCPSDIPVADIFKAVSKGTQDFFGYVPGLSRDEKIPYLNYKKEN